MKESTVGIRADRVDFNLSKRQVQCWSGGLAAGCLPADSGRDVVEKRLAKKFVCICVCVCAFLFRLYSRVFQ